MPDRSCRIAVRALTDSDQVLGALVCVMDVTDLKAEAATDPLTGLHNRTSIFNCLRLALSRPEPTGVVYVDIDGFKSVNDNGGHAAGDRVLVEVADALRQAVREGDSVGRVGGDEFVAVCPRVSSAEALLEVALRLQTAAAGAIERSGHPSDPTSAGASVGFAWSESGQLNAEELVRRADSAMYVGKRHHSGTPVQWELSEV
jgi:diguanylate cyclase (GGDEF)-like protein